MQLTSLSNLSGGGSTVRMRRRVAAGLLSVGLLFGGAVGANPAGAQVTPAVAVVDRAPAVAIAPAGDVAPQFNNRVCNTLDRLANRFSNFPLVQRIINALRASFGCISPG